MKVFRVKRRLSEIWWFVAHSIVWQRFGVVCEARCNERWDAAGRRRGRKKKRTRRMSWFFSTGRQIDNSHGIFGPILRTSPPLLFVNYYNSFSKLHSLSRFNVPVKKGKNRSTNTECLLNMEGSFYHRKSMLILETAHVISSHSISKGPYHRTFAFELPFNIR